LAQRGSQGWTGRNYVHCYFTCAGSRRDSQLLLGCLMIARRRSPLTFLSLSLFAVSVVDDAFGACSSALGGPSVVDLFSVSQSDLRLRPVLVEQIRIFEDLGQDRLKKRSELCGASWVDLPERPGMIRGPADDPVGRAVRCRNSRRVARSSPRKSLSMCAAGESCSSSCFLSSSICGREKWEEAGCTCLPRCESGRVCR
jgi:hypothetical protein